MKKRRKMLTIVCVMAVSLLAVSCQQAFRPETVLLQGAVTIGPISPVEKPGECPPVPPDVFASRKLLIYDESGKHLVREVYFTQIGNGATGYYTAQLAPGTYTIDINHMGMDTADNLPEKITVAADETITIDVHIDTGIR
ncbi:MAG: carboxypeptidase-like regulatory domain-containing protein [Dehalococcoidales bacterium]|nr:carboxypeptidase-like regulatory domain-containing protein [Dehalococcoidales bacterium]